MIILSRKEKKISKWLTLVKKKVKNSNHDQETYYSFKTFNYIVIIAKNKCGKISVVRQFRPAREKNTLEFPAGLKDKKISIKEIVKNELKEETGLIPISNIKLICKLTTDNGRMENNLFGYFVKTKTINIQEPSSNSNNVNNDSSTISLSDLKELQSGGNMPKRSGRRKKSASNTVSLDI